MKITNKLLIALLGVAMMAASCTAELDGVDNTTQSVNETQSMTFTATHEEEESDVQTRTAISEKKINWQDGDAISVWDGTQINTFITTPDADDPTFATITGSVTSGSTSFCAVYPDSLGKSCTYTADAISGLVIPTAQTATDGSYDPTAAVMTAATTSKTLSFKNVCSFLKIPNCSYRKIIAKVGSGNIAGSFSVNPSTGVITDTIDGENVVKLAGDNSNYSDKYIAIAPGTYKKLKLIVYDPSKTPYKYYEMSKNGTVTFKRNSIYNMGYYYNWNHLPILPGEYSVSETKKVNFTSSNLKATYDDYGDGASYTWRIEEAYEQYDYVGERSGNTTIDSPQYHYSVDLFGWSSTKTNGISTSQSEDDYYDREDGTEFVDWGTYVSDGDYRTLTGDEWKYLLETRTVNGGTGDGHSYKFTKLHTQEYSDYTYTYGLLIVPDDYNGTLSSETSYSDWGKMQLDGVAFLPAAGIRDGSQVWRNETEFDYWTSTPAGLVVDEHGGYNFERPRILRYSDYNGITIGECEFFTGCSVRLVRDIE